MCQVNWAFKHFKALPTAKSCGAHEREQAEGRGALACMHQAPPPATRPARALATGRSGQSAGGLACSQSGGRARGVQVPCTALQMGRPEALCGSCWCHYYQSKPGARHSSEHQPTCRAGCALLAPPPALPLVQGPSKQLVPHLGSLVSKLLLYQDSSGTTNSPAATSAGLVSTPSSSHTCASVSTTKANHEVKAHGQP